MNQQVTVVRLAKAEPLHVQIYRNLRRQIEANELPSGSRLPTNQELARRFETGIGAVQMAVNALAQEGFVTRRRKLGTIVCGNDLVISHAGIYFDQRMWAQAGFGFHRSLYLALQSELAATGTRVRLLVDLVAPQPGQLMASEFRQMVRDRGIQALAVPLWPGGAALDGFAALGIPFSIYGSFGAPHHVWHDWTSMFAHAAAYLRRMGRRRAGLITSVPAKFTGFFDAFRAAAAAEGLDTDPLWTVRPEADGAVAEGSFDQFGYDGFGRLWDGPSRPDGLIVFPDSMAKGVLFAACRRGVDIPGDLALVVHQNEEDGEFLPVEAGVVLTGAARVARAMVGQLFAQVRRQPANRILLGFDFASRPGPGR